ncbi:hypothetical protein RhiirA4_504510 [Rhizophagus irregularis]|uniref:Uncharacterized protein n=1 Tax=Rhizophagus irregularis TaxID=588596 RepID=A0A2I1H9H5_9GLOM|nr:hypothetical protein RhiirA4_504510 [Rhizophagus irregularis]
MHHDDFSSTFLCLRRAIINKNDFTEIGIVDEFSKYMYQEHEVYFVSNLTNLNSELCQFQESDISSLSGLVLSSKNENLHLVLPILKCNYGVYYICKMNVKKILSKDCFIKFIFNDNYQKDLLKHKDVSKLEGLGWIEYRTSIRDLSGDTQLSIEINSIEMQIEYIRFGKNLDIITYIPDMNFMGHLLPVYREFFLNVPETFKDKNFLLKKVKIDTCWKFTIYSWENIQKKMYGVEYFIKYRTWLLAYPKLR